MEARGAVEGRLKEAEELGRRQEQEVSFSPIPRSPLYSTQLPHI